MRHFLIIFAAMILALCGGSQASAQSLASSNDAARTMTEKDWRALVDRCYNESDKAICEIALVELLRFSKLTTSYTRDLSDQTCKVGSAWGCTIHGSVWVKVGNHVWGHQFYLRACDMGYAYGCEWMTDYRAWNEARATSGSRYQRELERQNAAAAASMARRSQSSTYAPSSGNGTQATPFGSSTRDRSNWRRYQENQRCSNPTASGC